MTFGQRLRALREQRGMSRPVLGGLVGKSAEWVKGLENGRLLPPRLPVLLQLAQALQADDLAALTGDERVTSVSYGKTAHEQLPEIADALARHPITAGDSAQVDAGDLAARVAQTWDLWHGTRRHRTAVATLLPGLLHDARVATRGEGRRAALGSLAQVYHLTQLFLSFQPVPELVTLAGDRAMTAALDTDDPHTIAASAWYSNHVYRDAGQQHEARVQLALDARGLLHPESADEDRALWGLLSLAVALSFAKVGREGDAWRYWDDADEAARALPLGYSHPWLKFGRPMVDAYAITILADLMRGGDAVTRADRVDLDGIGSATRSAFHTIETARAYHQQREHVATLALVQRAYQEAPETARFNLFTRSVVADMAANGGATVRRDAVRFAGELGIIDR
ncbi:transcriptional regulator with XRE-family HTH domain [Herbihabitans rhizosphaerae]|uniref:Transcriptional regulator with XRE-family HTH domain n=1 Tax=Herbihabitans rhizosphaerae TaxID=1872711 RepID=A0A4Q7KNK9_9PSEU|nr:helix-turn-helix transcriptional regulator [Herbihabitans rhizosphaerae]RZS36812.1 transcriptional regulator with XRE-family HTH domain [Herbihabitans rhizosphaerae]